jgi:pentapeptide repeat protein
LAESPYIEILRRGPRAWNAWREENPSQNPNLDHAALSLGERQFGPINGGPINLRSASMRGAHLRFASLSRASLEGTDLSEADLAHARLDGANLTAANLSCAVLDHVDFADAILSNANLTGASLRHVQNLTQNQINLSICDATTIFPAHLVHPIAMLKVVRKAHAAWGDRSQMSVLVPNSRI